MRILAALVVLACSFAGAQAGETWNFAATVLTPSQPWEYTAANPLGSVFEPKVLKKQTGCLIGASPCLALWYSGAWDQCSVGYAESTDLTGKTPFVKYRGNPIIGQGNGPLIQGAPPTLGCRKTVFFYNGIYYIVFVGNATAGRLFVTWSADGVTALQSPAQGLLGPGPQNTANANSFMFQYNNQCWLLFDSLTTNPNAAWQAFKAAGPCPLGPFIVVNGGNPLTSLQPAAGSYGVPAVMLLNGQLNYWLLGNPSSWVPSDIYHECDPVGPLGARIGNGGLPIIAHRGPAFDQAADPWPIDLDVGTIFVDEDQNPPDGAPYAVISTWKTTGPLASISCP